MVGGRIIWGDDSVFGALGNTLGKTNAFVLLKLDLFTHLLGPTLDRP